MSDTTEPVAHDVPQKGMSQLSHIETTRSGLQVVRTVHTDGTVDFVDKHAVGGNFEEMPKGYYTSYQFILTFVAICLASICAYLGWVLPANTLYALNQNLNENKSKSY